MRRLRLPRRARRERAPATLGSLLVGIALYVVCAAFMLWHARLLVRPDFPTGELAAWAALALLPALAAAVWRRAPWWAYGLLALPVLVFLVGNQTGHWPFRPHMLGYSGYFARVWEDLSTGAHSWIQVTLPFDPVVEPQLRMAVTTALVLLLLLTGASILVWQAPLLAVLTTFTPFAVVSTVFRVGDEVLRSAMMLGIALLLIGVVDRGRLRTRPAFAAGLGAGVVALAVAVAAVPGVAKGAYLPWRTWADISGTGVSVKSYVWDHTYGPLVWPETPTEVMRVRSPRSSYWRATVLEDFDGIGWRAAPDTTATAEPGEPLEVPEEQLAPAVREATGDDVIEVRFTNRGLADPLILTTGQTLAVSGVNRRAGALRLSSGGEVQSDRPPPMRSTYRVQTVMLDPTPEELNAAGTDYPEEVVERSLTLLEDVTFPAFGTPGRDDDVRAILAREFYDPRLVDWAQVYEQAREVTASATTPYEAVVALESYFQANFRYDETADYSTAPNGPLPAFFLGEERNGYCQMFSGSMAAILRMLGIPARIAEGFTPGDLDPRSGRFVVTDRNAHAWVEVYFPGYGWLPFEPTPSRALDSRFSGTSTGFNAAAQAAAAGSALLAEILRERGALGLDGLPSGGGRVPFDERGAVPSPTGVPTSGVPVAAAADRGWRPGTFTYAAAALVVLAVLFLLLKRFRVLLAYLHRDPHRVAAAVRGDLQAWVIDQGITDGGRALTPNEFGAMLKREFAVDASGWARQHTRARYGPMDEGAYQAAVAARAEARVVKRRIRESLTTAERLRGAIDVRSLVP